MVKRSKSLKKMIGTSTVLSEEEEGDGRRPWRMIRVKGRLYIEGWR
jgi:hypothetical protein